jgi:hypothetical protein
MGMALKIDFEEPSVSAEAKKRLNSARARDIAFIVKQRLGRSDPSDDIDMIVEMIQEAEEQHRPITRESMVEYLRRRGRSPHRAEQLTALLFK